MALSSVVRTWERATPVPLACDGHDAAIRTENEGAALRGSDARCVRRPSKVRGGGCYQAIALLVGWLFLVEPSARAQAPLTDLPSAADTMSAYRAVDAWVREGGAPSDAQPIDPPGTEGASITLRLGGQVIGRGASMSKGGDAIWSAARQAWVQAVETLPVEHDALRAERVKEVLPRVTIDLELAGRLTPLLGETEAAIGAQVSPGIEGLAARVGERMEALFPGMMLSTNTTPEEAVRIAAGKLGLPPLPLRDLATKHRLTLYRFPARHLAQTKPLAEPVFLYRGGRVVGAGEITGLALRQASAAIARHLMSHDWPGAERHGMTGDYLPLVDRFQPMIAPPLEQGAVALALTRFASVPGMARADADKALRFASRILTQLAQVTPDETDPLADPLAAAMWLAAFSTDPSGKAAVPVEFAESARRQVLTCWEGGNWSVKAPPAGRGLIAYALALDAADESPEVASAMVRTLFRDTDRSRLVSEMPWLGWAELATTGPDQPVPATDALLEMRRTLWDFQLSSRDLGQNEADMLGGIVFTRGRNPIPTWHTLRPLAFVATMLGDRRLTPDPDVVPELAHLRPSLRFAIQLQLEETLGHMAREPARGTGGVRPALWDQTASLEASSMALLTLCETLHAMDARAKK